MSRCYIIPTDPAKQGIEHIFEEKRARAEQDVRGGTHRYATEEELVAIDQSRSDRGHPTSLKRHPWPSPGELQHVSRIARRAPVLQLPPVLK